MKSIKNEQCLVKKEKGERGMKAYKFYVVYNVKKKGKVIGKGAMETYMKDSEITIGEAEVLADSLIQRHPGADDIEVKELVLLGEVEGEREDESL
jgi:N-acetylglutamate synthase-like GNAT family acetyltransferase